MRNAVDTDYYAFKNTHYHSHIQIRIINRGTEDKGKDIART